MCTGTACGNGEGGQTLLWGLGAWRSPLEGQGQWDCVWGLESAEPDCNLIQLSPGAPGAPTGTVAKPPLIQPGLTCQCWNPEHRPTAHGVARDSPPVRPLHPSASLFVQLSGHLSPLFPSVWLWAGTSVFPSVGARVQPTGYPPA